MDRQTGLLIALAIAAAAWIASRTRAGTQAIQSAASSAVSAGAWLMSQIRGIRNNNPGNIRRTSDQWIGMSADQSSDPVFVVFDTPQYGIRALARVLRSYYDQGLTTVRAMITRWAPPSENDTDAYVAAVANYSGLSADVPIDSIDLALPLLVPAIIMHENGTQPYTADLIAQGITLEQTA